MSGHGQPAAGRSRRLRLGALGMAMALVLLLDSAGPAHAAPSPNPGNQGNGSGSGSITPCLVPVLILMGKKCSVGGTALKQGAACALMPVPCLGGKAATPTNKDSTPSSDQDRSMDTVLGPITTPGMDQAPIGNYHVYYDDGSVSASGPCGNPVIGVACSLDPTGIARAGSTAIGAASVVAHPAGIIGQIEGWLTDTMFTASKWVSSVGLHVLGWVFDSQVRDWIDNLIQPALKVAGSINVRLLGPLNLAGFFLLLTLLYAGWQTLRGRTGAGVGEFGLSLVIYMVALIVLVDPATGFKNAVDGITNISDQVMDASLANGLTSGGFGGNGRCPAMHATDARHAGLVKRAQANGTIKPDFGAIQCILRVELIDVPYDLLNWGKVIAPNSPCWAQRQEILNKGIGAGDNSGILQILQKGGDQCVKMYSKNPSMDRFFAALLFLLSVLVMMGLLIVTAGMDLIALLMGIFLLMWIWPMFALGLLPGTGRRSFWRYATSFVVSAASVIVMSAFLAVLVWGCATALDSTTGLPIALRFLLMDIVGLMLLRLRRTMHHKVATAVRNTGDRMPGAKGTVAAAAAGGAAGGAGGGGGGGGGQINWGGSPGRPHPGKGAHSMSMWVQPAHYQSPRMAAPHELAAQGEQKFWHSKPGNAVARAKHGVKTLYPVRHPIKTITSPVRAVTHPIKTAKAPFKPLPKPKQDAYPDGHPWIPD